MSPQEFYESPWHHPGLLASVGLVALTLALRDLLRAGPEGRAASPFFFRWLALAAPAIVLDAWLTAPITPLSPRAAHVAAIAFVMLGDARFYLLAWRYGHHPRATDDATLPRALAIGLAWSLAASLAVGAANALAPAFFAVTRRSFLLYELLSLGLVLTLRLVLLPRNLDARGASPAVRRWVLGVASFVAVQYTLWALADVLLFAGVRLGWILRIVPNLLYYGAFVEFVRRTAPREIRP